MRRNFVYLEYTILLKNVYFEYTFSHYRAFESEAICDTSLSTPTLEGASEFPVTPLNKRRTDDRQERGGGSPIGKLGPAQLAYHARAEDKRERGERQTEAQDHAPQRRHAFVGELRDDVAEPEDDGLHDDAKHERASVVLLRNPVATSPPLSEQVRKAR